MAAAQKKGGSGVASTINTSQMIIETHDAVLRIESAQIEQGRRLDGHDGTLYDRDTGLEKRVTVIEASKAGRVSFVSMTALVVATAMSVWTLLKSMGKA